MIQIKTLEIAGFASTLQALRLPFGLNARSGANFWERWYAPDEENKFGNFRSSTNCDINAKDLTLMATLIKRGDEHAKAIRGIIVYAEINAPRYWWSEADTYRAGTERLSSESTMHMQGRGLSTEELIAMKETLTEGTMQKRVQYFSYQTLRRIYKQRKDHRLPHWHIFCDWIKTLPFADELITIGIESTTTTN